MIEIAAACESFKRGKIFSTGLARSEQNTANASTESTFRKTMDSLTRTGCDHETVEQWTDRAEEL